MADHSDLGFVPATSDHSDLGFVPAGAAPAAQPTFFDRAVDAVHNFASGVGEQVNPIAILKGARDAAANVVYHPIDTVNALGQAQGQVGQKAVDSFKSGDYATGVRHAINWLLPVIGPQIDALSDEMATNPAHALGSAAGLGLTMAAPDSPVIQNAASKLRPAAVVPKFVNPNPVTAAAVDFGRANDIPVSAATATGNKFVAGVQHAADYSPIGSVVAQNAKAAEAKAFTRVGNEIADRVYPQSVVPETAGAAVADRLDKEIASLRTAADSEYNQFRTAADDPKNLVKVPNGAPVNVKGGVLDAQGNPVITTVQPTNQIPMAVDMRAIKDNLAPLYQEMEQWMPISARNSSEGWAAVKGIVEGPDYMPATAAEKGLSGLKAMAREAISPDLRNVSQGIGANAAGQLQAAIDQAAAKAGPEVLEALKAGRAAHAEKMQVADVMQKLRDEPVQLFNQATFAGDAGIDQLRQASKIAPAEMPMVGRAYLEKLLGTATAEGGFDKAGNVATQWQKLGPETKKILFKNPMVVQDLDNFFTLAKRAADNPNPSGSATLASVVGGLGYMFKDPITGVPMVLGAGVLSKLLHSPRAVEALTNGLKVSTANKAAATIAANRILKVAGSAVQPLPSTPAAAAQANPSPQTALPELAALQQ